MLERREILDNPSSVKMRRIAGLSRRSARLKSSLIRIEGAQALREALRFAPDSVEDVYLTEAAGVSEPELLSLVEAAPVHGHWVSERVARAVAEAAQGWFATASFAVFPPLHELRGRVALILPETQDPGNVGTMLRLADACGAGSVFMGEQSADVSSPKVIRASVGSVFHVPTPRFSDLAQLVSTLHESQWLVAGTALDAPLAWGFEVASQFADKKVAWMMGNEAHGLNAAQRELCDVLMAIPMFGQAESFNVSQAATLALWMTAHAQTR
ncbi:TrmH family RNA methyltransferase [Mobiluncus mulieris]|uniref:RNA methyltransferase n=1 Tax=Mobiluncus mulieris TaxID=2052 RepID=A0A7Y0USG5_9ACTO|nr:RNA methyltransferase [Mobiluncus mulieris]NMX02901.1 RNA methyltransferase [Mobiluncus mulieris]NMX11861.1 RNA methyltransferase [Mobiluncus mulieris]